MIRASATILTQRVQWVGLPMYVFSVHYLTEAPMISLYNETLLDMSGVAMATWLSFPSFHNELGTWFDDDILAWTDMTIGGNRLKFIDWRKKLWRNIFWCFYEKRVIYFGECLLFGYISQIFLVLTHLSHRRSHTEWFHY